VNFPWSICLAREDVQALAALRLVPGIEAAEAGELIWLRGKGSDEQLDAKLAALPVRGRYEWIAPFQLREIGKRIPSARLPELHWQPLSNWLQVELPVAALPASEPASIPLRLVRSSVEHESDLLLTSLAALNQFAAESAQVRLDRLQFAANGGCQVLVRGRPLPPLPGHQFILHGCIAVPAGFFWEPAVGPDVLAQALSATGDTLLLWNEDGTITRLHGEQFVPATRSAIRATALALAKSP
jgi:hypothetical protein